MNVKKMIYVVFKTHFDIGFTELAEELVKRWDSKMFPDLIKICDATKDSRVGHKYVWTLPSWVLYRYLTRFASSKEAIEQTRRYIADGQIEWHALPFTTYTEFCGLEEYIRGIYFSKKLTDGFGRRSVTAKMTDVVGHTWILPTLLSKAGVKFLHLGPNQACKLPEVPPLFFWEGPDESRVLVFYNKEGGYGSTLLPPDDWAFPVWLALMQTNDNLGPQGIEDLGYIFEEAKREAPGTKLVIGSMDDFYRELSKYPLDSIPVVRGDIADTWIHGTGTMPEETGKLRNLRHNITETEKALSTGISGGLFNKNEILCLKHNIDEAYENCLLFGEHTWGLNTFDSRYMKTERYYKKIDLRKNGDIERFESSWDEHRRYYYNAKAEMDAAAPKIMNAIASSVCVKGPRLSIFSGLGWNRSGWVDIDAFKEKTGGKIPVDTKNGDLLDMDEISGKLHVYVNDLPAFGYKTIILKENIYRPVKKASSVYDAAYGTLENWWYRITADPSTGTIKSIKDKSTGHEWVGRYKDHGFAQYQYDIYSGDEATRFLVDSTARFYEWQVSALVRKDYYRQEHIRSIPSGAFVDGMTGECSATMTMRSRIRDASVMDYGNIKELVTKITVYDNQPYIDLQYDLIGKEKTFCVESGHFVFPVNLENTQININKLGSVINPAVDIIEGGNHNLYCCENWVDITDGEKGMAVIPFDTHLFSIGSLGILNCRREYVREEPIFFFNAFNNSYGCNFPQWMGGDYSFRFRLIPHTGDWKKGNVARMAFESVAPPLAGFSDAVGGKYCMPVNSELIKELDGMEIITLKQAEKGCGCILRLRDISGERHHVTLSFDECFETLTTCDLLENVLDDLPIYNGEVRFETKPFEIHTFLLR